MHLCNFDYFVFQKVENTLLIDGYFSEKCQAPENIYPMSVTFL